MCRSFLLLIVVLCRYPLAAQEETADSLRSLEAVTVRAFEQNRPAGSSTAMVKTITFNNGDRYTKTSLVNGFNTVAGVRMEERSPGSYRINIRGSSLRSPFGVRNVKVYWNDIPFTDPGGNTYFNQLAWNNFSYAEIFKGPAGSMYGAGTGGLVLLHSLSPWQPGVSAEYITGSYNLQNFFFDARMGKKENKSQLSFAHNQTDGYRVQSRMGRDNFSWVSKADITEKQKISFTLLLTNLYYQTPGALTLAEYNANPKAARPAAGVLPSAVAAKAAIEQMGFTGGFTHQLKFTPRFSNSTSFYGAFTEIKNPAIRNYEKRDEPHFGGRSVFTYDKKSTEGGWQLTGGTEFQNGFFNTSVFRNRNGEPDSLQTEDDIFYRTAFYFLQGDLSLAEKWIFTGGLSINRTHISFTRLNRFPIVTQERKYRNELAPRFALKRRFGETFSLTASLARGFSPPTISELLPSTGVISTHLEAEYGWNYELSADADLFQRRLQLNASGYYFRLHNALVQRRDSSGADFFVNAGDTRQKGVELSAHWLITSSVGFLQYCILDAAGSFQHFRYGSFRRAADDFTGKILPSVPARSLSLLADFQFKKGWYSQTTFYTASRIYLNDANTAYEGDYQLLGGRLGWKKTWTKKYKLNIYIGADNLLDQTYSLGNDINAAANRFYNAAPGRNFYAGVAFQWVKQGANK